MQFTQKTVLELFDASKKSFTIPVYQRAYAWRDENWQELIDDLAEQIASKNNYFFGNLLLETLKKGTKYEVIDGQQRLTTILILIRALMTILKERVQDGDRINVDFQGFERIFFRDGGNIKLRPVDYDRSCFDALIIDGEEDFPISTPSQSNMLNARNYFRDAFNELSNADLVKILTKVIESELTCIELPGKKDSALMFELQNNRGRDLTNMEKIKSFFMYQMYVYSPPRETERNIQKISDVFKLIYSLINDLTILNEDSVLIYHCNAHLSKGFNYRTLEDIKDTFKNSANKIGWINNFISELHTTFSNLKRLEHLDDPNLKNLTYLRMPAFVYPFIIKGLKLFRNDKTKLTKLFRLLEIIAFRQALLAKRADLVSRLNDPLVKFDGDLIRLRDRLTAAVADYWNDFEVRWELDHHMYGNRVLNYVLWRYEASLQGPGYNVGNYFIEKEQIEHISPRTAPGVAAGYQVNGAGVYDDDFRYTYLEKIGNLMLISGSHNASIGNRPFKEKLDSYKRSPQLKQQSEIPGFLASKKAFWGKKSIEARQKAIVFDFAMHEWSFDAVDL